MQLLKKRNTSTVQFLKVLLILFADVLILPWHTPMYIILPKDGFVVTQAVSPQVRHCINVFDACTTA
jgi:hypothetical protein